VAVDRIYKTALDIVTQKQHTLQWELLRDRGQTVECEAFTGSEQTVLCEAFTGSGQNKRQHWTKGHRTNRRYSVRY